MRFMHMRYMENGKFLPHGGLTLAYDDDMWAAAVCSLNDNFSKKRGRAIAAGRLEMKPWSLPEGSSPPDERLLTFLINALKEVGDPVLALDTDEEETINEMIYSYSNQIKMWLNDDEAA